MLNNRHLKSFLLLLVLQPDLSRGADLYRWVDEDGTVHMTDSLSQVPTQYQDQARMKTLRTATQPEASSRAPGPTPTAGLRHSSIQYQAFEGSSRRIIIPVTFNESVTARMLLDTGSPGLVISPELAGRLGLLEDEGGNLIVMAGGIGGSVPAILSVVDSVTVGDARSEFLPATITRIPSNEFEGVVGMDFMANYRIGIDTKSSIVVFDELPPQADRPGGHDETWWRSNFQNFTKLRAQWSGYLDNLERESLTSSEKERRTGLVKKQVEEADKLCRKLERYARDNSVPTHWRH